jgi:hypothetical protein
MQMRITDTIRAVFRHMEDTVRGARETDENQEMTSRETQRTTHLVSSFVYIRTALFSDQGFVIRKFFFLFCRNGQIRGRSHLFPGY